MIASANLSKYRIKEFIQFVRNSLIIVNQHNADKLQVKAQYNGLNKEYLQLEQAYKQESTSETGVKLSALDDQRDQAIICLRMISEGYIRHPKATLRAAGEQVVECINKYGTRLYNLNYSAETAALKNIGRDLQTIPAYAQAIKDMHLEDVVSEMKKANQAFEKVFIQRLEETSKSKEETPNTRQLVQSTSEAYRTLVKHIEARATLSPSAKYTLFINHFNENIEHFNQIIERRRLDTTDEPVVL
ncbi:DUF6261 family protein [Tunicatimonas pelagia]|uniref:DUF6261 family protein n=1 Tax=Tunicatimonas pelagia TaxID=931531 RepID=UPI0026662C64|nr:DUF6261 family protein [Tunicatimonas pelagia]WKN41042.1 DUF6261 family protein [Tunicatimonas pelagia]